MPDGTDIGPPLAGLRVIDAVAGPLASITRYLAELGAVVMRAVPPGPAADAFEDLAANYAKQGLGFGLNDPRMISELANAHAVVTEPGALVDLAAMRRAKPSLVTMTASGFGSDTSFTGWQMTDPVLHALSGELARSGIRGRPPLLPPGRLATECASAQAAYVLISAL